MACHDSPVRIVPLLLISLLTLTASAIGQVQEQKLWQRLDRKLTDETVQKMEFDTRQASFSGGRTFNSKSANTKSFHYKQKASPGEFRSKTFAGSKSAWMGDFKFSTRKANTSGKYEIPNLTRKADTKTVEVADARESNKSMPGREYSKSHRPYLGREAEKMKKAINPGQEPAGWTGDLQEMTIDDIRELLNKNK